MLNTWANNNSFNLLGMLPALVASGGTRGDGGGGVRTETHYQCLRSNLHVADIRREAEQRETRRERGVKNIPGGKKHSSHGTASSIYY